MSESVGNKIKKIRQSKSISTYELSKLTGISQSTISKLENGKRSADIEIMNKVADGLKVKITDLIEDLVIYDSKDTDNDGFKKIEPVVIEALMMVAKSDPSIEKALNQTILGNGKNHLQDLFQKVIFDYINGNMNIKLNDNSEIIVATHNEQEDWSVDEKREIESFKEYIRSKRKSD